MPQMEISVIIPVFNAEKYLGRCIQSLQNQTFRDFEMIFINDGSADRSIDVLHQAASTDARIIVIDKSNGGPSSARNAGIKRSSGKYLMFCDSDDTVEPLWMETMLGAIENHPDSLVCCGINVVAETGELLHKMSYDFGVHPKSDYYPLFKSGLTGSSDNKIFSANLIKSNSLFYDENLRRGEDVLFCLDYLNHCTNIYVVKETLYNYYRYSSAITLTNQFHNNDFAFELMLYERRLPYISEEYRSDFDLHYWHVFCQELDRTNTLSDLNWFAKMAHNQEIICDRVFQVMLRKYGRNEMNYFMYKALCAYIYPGYWIIQKASEIKRKFFNKRRGG